MNRYRTMNLGASSVASMAIEIGRGRSRTDTLIVRDRCGCALGNLSLTGPCTAPAPVHPPPLLGVAHDESLECRVVRARRAQDCLVRVRDVDRRDRRFEA